MDVNSGTNDGTKFDAILYDRILAKTIPWGRVPWAFTYSDAHSPGQFDRAFTIHMLPPGGATEAKLRTSMEDGTFFGFARHARLDLGDGFKGEGDPPAVSNITVNEAAGTIAITATGYDTIIWVTDGSEEVARGATLDIAAHDASIGSYVRAYLLGPGGILYVQPFTVLRAGQALEKEEIPKVFDSSVPLRFLSDTMEFVMKLFPPLRWVWWLLTWFDPAVDLPRLMKLVGYVA